MASKKQRIRKLKQRKYHMAFCKERNTKVGNNGNSKPET